MGGIFILAEETCQVKPLQQNAQARKKRVLMNLLYCEGMHPPASRIPRAQIRIYLDIYWLESTKLHR